MKSIKDTYNYYKQNETSPITKSEYLDINNRFNNFLISKMIEGFEITLPCRLGVISIVGKTQRIRYDEKGNIIGLAPDWQKTIQLWNKNEEAKKLKKKVYHLNSHSSNIKYRFFWSKKRVLIKNKTLYSFVLSRANKRKIAYAIKKGHKYSVKS